MSAFDVVAVDIETYDPGLGTLGSGSIRKDGFVLTVCLADKDSTRAFNLGVPEDVKLLRAILADPTIIKVAHNGVYDYDWLQNGLGYELKGSLEDTMTREGLINEYYGSYNLDVCCKRHKITGKNYDDTIENWWKAHGFKGKAIENLNVVPLETVNKYCCQDARATYDLFISQSSELEKQRLIDVNALEKDIMPVVLEMKKNGIRLDLKERDRLIPIYTEEVMKGEKELFQDYGIRNISSPIQVKEMMHSLGIVSPKKTAAGGESYDFKFLKTIEHPGVEKMVKIKKLKTALSKFLEGSFTTHEINGRLHTTFYPTLRDEGGTITGRFSSRDPNLQNISVRDSETEGGTLRYLFLPEEDHYLGSFDYKQIEYMLFAHYAVGPGSESVREKIRSGVDYHQVAMDMLGWTSKDARTWVKTFNFGVLYGLGLHGFQERLQFMFVKEARKMGTDLDTYMKQTYGVGYEQHTANILNQYYRNMSFVKPSVHAIGAVAAQNGLIRSVSGRCHRLPPDRKNYKIVNYLIQGSAADVMKMGMVYAWRAGIFDVLKLHLTIHDELVFSIPKTKQGAEACQELQRLLIQPGEDLKLKVPLRVDCEIGDDWGNCSNNTYEKFLKEVL